MFTKNKLLIAASVMSIVSMTGIANTANAASQQTLIATAIDVDNSQYTIPPANAQGQRRYIIRFKEPAVARYNGGGELTAIPRNADNSIQINATATISYVEHIKQQQNNFLNSISSVLGRDVTALLSFQYSYNGMAVYLGDNEIAAVKNNSQVAEVQLDKDYKLNTDAGPQLIGADNVWLGTAPASGAAFGAGVVIGTLDSGLNFDHPSFADIGGDAYDHINPLGAGNYLGVCDAANTAQFDVAYTCNDKLIGGYDFVNALVPPDGSTDIPGPEDENGHGSHTASTSGGNVVLTAEANGVSPIAISGVAPHATVIIFDTCFETPTGQGLCPGASAIASVDQALADGLVNVINYSIGGGVSPWTDPVSQAFLNATDAGIFVATSAGNSGPAPATLGHVEPWTSSSGASTHNRRFSNNLNITGPAPVPINLTGVLAIQGTGPVLTTDMTGTIAYSGIVDAANVEGCNAFTALAFDGVIALISRGACNFVDKVNNAVAAGAIGVVVHNNRPGDPIIMGGLETTTVSSVMVAEDNGLAVAAFIGGNPIATVSVSANTAISLGGLADSLASFSSRGPSPFEYNKPDVTAPGVSILAAFHDDDVATGTPAEYGIISGTSMASPHNAGAAALMKQLHPSWTAAEIKSALMMTAVTAGVTKEDGTTPADPFDRGAGRVQVDVASATGLVMHETAFQFLLADPANGGDPKTLNVPNLTNYDCVGTCLFQREFKSVAAGIVNYTASLTGITGTVTPSSFTINPGATITLDIEVDGAALTAGATSFGELLVKPIAPDVAFTVNPSIAITDAGYTSPTAGTAGMVCEDIIVSGVTNAPFTTNLILSMSHNDWLADLTVKLANPAGDLLTLLNESSAGNAITLDSSIPISFFDGAAASADTLGSDGVAFGAAACTSDPCEFFPFANAEATPPATFVDLSVGDPNGTWQICVGDSAGGDTGILESATLNIAVSTEPTLHLPAVIIGFPLAPDIAVTPASLSASLDADMTVTQTLIISNSPVAGADLNWTILADNSAVKHTIIDQPTNGTQGIVSDFFDDGVANTGVYSADSFVAAGDVSIATASFGGFLSNGATNIAAELTAMTITVYADVAGEPAGHPEDGLSNELFTLTLPIADVNLDTGTAGDVVTFDILAANGSTLDLSAGTYWITAYGNFTGANRWNWLQGEEVTTSIAKLVDPGDIFGAGFTSWTDLDGIDAALASLSYNLLSGDLTCGATWLSTDIASGANTPGTNSSVVVTYDSTGLTPGVYNAAVCVDSDDPDEAQVVVPTKLTVTGPAVELIFADGFE